MIGIVVSLLLKLGLKQGAADKFAKPAMFAAMAVFAIPVLLGLKSCYDSSVVKNAVNEANVETLETKGKADANAADSRVEDVGEVRDTKEGFEDAINSDDPDYPDDPAVRLACKRLLNDGTKPADLPSDCGCSGRELCYGVQAAP